MNKLKIRFISLLLLAFMAMQTMAQINYKTETPEQKSKRMAW